MLWKFIQFKRAFIFSTLHHHITEALINQGLTKLQEWLNNTNCLFETVSQGIEFIKGKQVSDTENKINENILNINCNIN